MPLTHEIVKGEGQKLQKLWLGVSFNLNGLVGGGTDFRGMGVGVGDDTSVRKKSRVSNPMNSCSIMTSVKKIFEKKN